MKDVLMLSAAPELIGLFNELVPTLRYPTARFWMFRATGAMSISRLEKATGPKQWLLRRKPAPAASWW